MKRKVKGSVVVITGASSGIGRAAALAFAKRGANLVLGARDATALLEVVRACEELGADAIAEPTDVRDQAAVDALRGVALARFGRIDTWVNDAAIYMMGTIEKTPAPAFREILSTNVMGVVHGSQAAIAQFRTQREGGVLITIGSVASDVTYAFAGAYCATKHAVKAIHQALRQELRGTNIEACLIQPATVDTPLFQHAANFSGRAIQAMPPVYSPERVAAAIVRCARRPARDVRIGGAPALMILGQRLFPALAERGLRRMAEREHLAKTPAADGLGNMARPTGPHAVRGGWKRSRRARNLALAAGALLVAWNAWPAAS